MNPTTANLHTIDTWLDQLATETDAAAHSATFTAYLDAMAKFWRYSPYNTLLILRQRPDAGYVNSRKRWRELGYTLKDGEWQRAIQILCPHFKTVTDAATGQEERILSHFSTGYVYDDGQVEPGPDAHPLTAPWTDLGGDYEDLYGVLIAVCDRLAITVQFRTDLPDDIKGVSNGHGLVTLNATLQLGNAVLTLLHEVAHEVVHPGQLRGRFSTQEVECQAEAIAYCCATALGMPTPNSGMYLALYDVTRQVLRANIDAIQQGVKLILGEVERVSGGQQDKRGAA